MSISIKRHINVDVFKDFIKSRGLSVTTLANLSESSEKTIKRSLKDGYVTLGVGIDLCRTLDCDFDELFGPDESSEWKKSMIKLYKIIR